MNRGTKELSICICGRSDPAVLHGSVVSEVDPYDLNFVADLYSGVWQAAHSYTPASSCLSYSPVPGYLQRMMEIDISHTSTFLALKSRARGNSSACKPPVLSVSVTFSIWLPGDVKRRKKMSDVRRYLRKSVRWSVEYSQNINKNKNWEKWIYLLCTLLPQDSELLRRQHGSPFLIALLYGLRRHHTYVSCWTSVPENQRIYFTTEWWHCSKLNSSHGRLRQRAYYGHRPRGDGRSKNRETNSCHGREYDGNVSSRGPDTSSLHTLRENICFIGRYFQYHFDAIPAG